MKKTGIFLMMFAIFTGCKEEIPAGKKIGDLTVCNWSLIKDTVDIPLSTLTEELQIVKLDNSDSALVNDAGVIVSDNYLLVRPSGSNPAKLFDRQTGKFIANIGSFGQGPGEYSQPVYHIQIQEKLKRIYFITFNARNILSYDLQGKFQGNISIRSYVPKCAFYVDNDTVITLVTLPFQGMKTLIWRVKGDETIQRYPVGHLSVPTDFSNEIMTTFNVENSFNFFIFNFEPKSDTLYHYDIEKNILNPAFVMDYGNAKVPVHGYVELPKHFMGFVSVAMITQKDDRGSSSTSINCDFIVDKQTLKGSFFRLKNDFLGNTAMGDIWSFRNGYFAKNFDPSVLIDELDKALANKDLPENMRTKLTNLKNSINENDNNYILYAKLKQ